MTRSIALIVGAALVAVVHSAHAQDPAKLSPSLYKVLLENERVRVLDFRIKAGQKEPMHSHPASVVYVLTGGKAKFTTQDGKSEIRESTPGQAIWSEPTTHAYEYLGPGDGHVLIVEMKGGARHATQEKKKL